MISVRTHGRLQTVLAVILFCFCIVAGVHAAGASSISLASTPMDIEWQLCLGGSIEDVGHSIQQTADGGYIVAGHTHSNDGDVTLNPGDRSVWVVKLNPTGGLEWQRCLGGSGWDSARSIQQTTDGGYIVAGFTTSNDGDVSGNNGLTDAWVVKLNATGDIEWQRCLGGSRFDFAYSIRQSEDGGYIVAGSTRSNDGDVSGNPSPYDVSSVWVVKLSPTGVLEWQRCLGGSAADLARSIRQTADGGYIVTGLTRSNDGDVSGHKGGADAWVVKLNATGGFEWQQCLGGSNDDYGHDIQQTADGGYIVAGRTSSDDGDVSGNRGGADAWVVKLNATGGFEWQQCLGGSAGDSAESIQQTADGGYIVGGYTNSNDGDVSGNRGGTDAWVVKLNAAGGIEWQRCLGGSAGDFAYSIRQTMDGGYIVAGSTRSNDGDVSGNHGGEDVWVVKLGDSPPLPVAFFYGAPTTGIAPLTVQFMDLSTGFPTSWLWEYSTGNPEWTEFATEQHPEHEFTSAGSYGIRLTVTNAAGSHTRTRDTYITITEPLIPTEWIEMTPNASWTPREGHSSVVLGDGSIVLMGGYDGSFKNDVWRSTDQGATWTQMRASVEWPARAGHSSVVLDDVSIVLMGGSSYGTQFNDVWCSIDQGATWMQVTASAEWSEREGHTSVVLPDGSIVVMGGLRGVFLLAGNGSGAKNDVWRSIDRGVSWTQVTANAEWSGRYDHSSVVLSDGSILVMGGTSGSFIFVDNEDVQTMSPEMHWIGYFNDVWRSTDQGATWTQMTPDAPWSPRRGFASVVLSDDSIMLMGGLEDLFPIMLTLHDSGYNNDVWISADNGISWDQLASASWSKRSRHTAVSLGDDTIFVMGGYDFIGLKNDVWRVEITEPTPEPVAAFIAEPTEGPAPLIVYFTDFSTGDPTAWSWEYSTGNPGWTEFSTEQHPAYEFTEAGTYSIRLTVTNAAGVDTETKDGYITVTAVPPPVGWTGVFGNGHWFVNDGHQGIADAWHFGAAGDEPFVLADGRTGVFGNGHWFVRDPATGGIDDAWHFGAAGDRPFVLADGRTGVFGNGHWFVNDGHQGIADAWHFGAAGDRPFVLADGRTGVFGNGHWFVRDSATGGIDDAWHFGAAGDTPFVLADGRTGVFGNGHWFVNDGHQGIADAWHFGAAGDRPVTGISV